MTTDATYATEDQAASARAQILASDEFGTCPECGQTDGYLNIGRGHWFYCRQHRVRWFVGSNLFGSWREQTEAEQRADYDALEFGSYREVEASQA